MPSEAAPRRWRLNYIVTYLDQENARLYRRFVCETLIYAAMLRRIDYAIEVEHLVNDSDDNSHRTSFDKEVVDIVYFRSSSKSLSSIREFRKIINGLFQGYQCLWGDPFDVAPQLQRALKKYPFPQKFYRPLSCHYIERYEGKKSTLFVTQTFAEFLSEELGDCLLDSYRLKSN